MGSIGSRANPQEFADSVYKHAHKSTDELIIDVTGMSPRHFASFDASLSRANTSLGQLNRGLPASHHVDWTIMTPTLSLGPWDSPSIEIMPWDIYPIIALMIETGDPLDKDVLESVWTFVQLDTLYLHGDSEGFFAKLEDTCQRIRAGELTHYSAVKLKNGEFAGYLDLHAKDGVVTPGVKEAAQRFLDFLAAHPDLWANRGPLKKVRDADC